MAASKKKRRKSSLLQRYGEYHSNQVILLSISKQTNFWKLSYFSFECAAKRTSKQIADSIQKANKAAKNTVRMEAHFTLNEDSINDQVQRALRREVSKLSPVSLPVTTPQSPRKTSKSRKNERSSSANRSKRRDLTRNGNQRKLSAPKKRGETICPSKNRADYWRSRKTLQFAFLLRTKA